METLWKRGPSSIRDVVDSFAPSDRLAYTTIQTVVYRLEEKKAIRRVSKAGNAHVFEATISENSARSRMLDELIALFGGKRLPIMTHLIESGKLTPDEVREARAALDRLSEKESR